MSSNSKVAGMVAMNTFLRILLLGLVVANAVILVSRWRPATPGIDLLSARRTFHTTLNGASFRQAGPAPEPPPEVYKLIRYPSPAGPLVAYLSPEPADGQKRPAVLWAHSGFGGIWTDGWDVEDDQSPRAFLNKDFILMCPSWRRENVNPGSFEMFFGEVDDLLAAIQYLRSVPYVDSNRIYVVGYSIGGTLALLAAESTNTFRAAFCIGATTDVKRLFADGKGYGVVPFDPRNEAEVAVRNPMQFIESLQVPTYYFEGGNSWEAPSACRMELLARKNHQPFHNIIVPGAHHWSVVQPSIALIADKIRNDTGPQCAIVVNVDEARRMYESMPQPQQVFD